MEHVLDDSQKGNFSDSLISVARSLGENKDIVIVGCFSGHVGSNAECW